MCAYFGVVPPSSFAEFPARDQRYMLAFWDSHGADGNGGAATAGGTGANPNTNSLT